MSALSDGSRRSSGSAFQAIGPATENAWRPSVLRRCRGTTRWWRLEDRSRWRLATSDVGWQQFMRYWGALPWRHRWTVTPSLWRLRCGTSSQCSSEWSRCVKPRSNFPVLLTTRAAAFSKRCSLSVMVLDDPANTVLQPSCSRADLFIYASLQQSIHRFVT